MVFFLRGVLVSVVASAAVGAQASYELLLVADQGNANVTPRIHRFDPVTQAYFGSFGAGIISQANGVEIDKNGIAWVADGADTVRLFNAYTGDYYGAIAHNSFSNQFGKVLGSNYWGNRISGLLRINTSTFAITVVPNPASSNNFIAPINSGEFFTGSGTTLSRINASTGAVISSQTLSIGLDGFYADAVVVPGLLGTTTSRMVAGRPNDGTNDLSVVNLSSTGIVTSSSVTNITSLNAVFGLAKAHRGFYAAGRLAADGTKGGITFIDDTFAQKFTFGSNVLINPRGMASVIAPEPGTMIALGLGVAALARRRRNRA